MARYIDADLLIEELKELQGLPSTSMSKVANEAIDLGLSLAMRTVRKVPTADVAEVCRCKECANGYHKTDVSVMCRIWDRLMITEDYCSYGAKMDGGEE